MPVALHVDPTTERVAIDRDGRRDAGGTVAFDVVPESAETLLPLVGLGVPALAAIRVVDAVGGRGHGES